MEQLSPEHRLILNCARIEMEEEVFHSSLKLIKEGVDWDSIFETAKNHNVAPLMFPNVRSLNKSTDIPPEILRQFRKQYHTTWIRNQKMYDELAILLKAFREKGIEVMLIKGAALALLVYKNIALRPMGDVDMLVKESDIEQIKAILNKLNYREDEPLRKEYFSNLFHHLPTYISLSAIFVEVKWQIIYGEKKVNFEYLIKTAVPVDIGDVRTMSPSSDEHLLIIKDHLLKHRNRGEDQILKYCDLIELKQFADKNNEKVQILSDSVSIDSSIFQINTKQSKDLFFLSSIKTYLDSIDGIFNKMLYIAGCIVPDRKFLEYHFAAKKNGCLYLSFIQRNLEITFKMVKSFFYGIKNT